MKKLVIYTGIIIIMIACKEKKQVQQISQKDFLGRVFPTYSPIGAEFSKIVDAVIEYDTARYIFNQDIEQKFYDSKFSKGYYNSNFEGEDDVYTSDHQQTAINLALEKLSNSKDDWQQYNTQIMDKNTYPNYSKLSKILKPLKQNDRIKFELPYEFYAFDKPLFTVDKKKALINTYYNCGALCGQGVVYFLKLENGKWKVTGYEYSYIT